ncbi:hypothetical protein AAHA92_19313 [Salvia divinorum]|uniref:PGG domain-containing protein n=1 Tax=Salvia divinorum TaxID=28513 RepID=A0ABD1H962_SALDI
MANSSTFPHSSSWAVNVGSFVSVKLRRDRNKRYNYEAWREQMLCLLESQGLAGLIEATPPRNRDDAWRRADRLVKGWILGALSDEIIKMVAKSRTARDVWSMLEYKLTKAKTPPAPPPPPPSAAPAYQGKEWHEYLALCRSAMRGEWDKTREFLNRDPGAVKVRMGFSNESALHVAVAAGKSEDFVANLLDLMDDDYSLALTDVKGNKHPLHFEALKERHSSLALTDGLGYNPLHIAALTGNHRAAEMLLNKCPKLLSLSNFNMKFPHHLAAEFGHRKVLDLLMSKTKDRAPFAGDGGLLLLVLMIDADFFDMALDLVDKNSNLATKNPEFIGEVLKKIAAKATTFSDEELSYWKRPIYWCILKMEMKSQSSDIENQTIVEPPWWRKLVSTPGQVIKYLVPGINRFHKKEVMRAQAITLVRCLCKHMESLDYEDALHIYRDTMLTAAESGNHVVVEEIVGTFPLAIHSRNSCDQNFLHLAVKSRCEKVFNLMYQSSNYRHHYSDKLDNCGNSILHLAAHLAPPHKLNSVSGAALQMQREIQWFKEVSKFVTPYTRGLRNYSGEIAEMIFTEKHKDLKIEGEKWMKDTANSCTIVAALIVTIVFAAAITVPGGNQSESGYPMFNKSSAFTIFAVSDAVSLFTSTTSLLMFLSILTSRYAEQDFLYALPKRLCIGLFTLFVSILFMMIAFSSTVYLVFGRTNAWVLIVVGALACLPISSFVLLQYPLIRDVYSSTYCRRVFRKQSDRPFP